MPLQTVEIRRVTCAQLTEIAEGPGSRTLDAKRYADERNATQRCLNEDIVLVSKKRQKPGKVPDADY
jgi:hypothetical protein